MITINVLIIIQITEQTNMATQFFFYFSITFLICIYKSILFVYIILYIFRMFINLKKFYQMVDLKIVSNV